MTMIFLATLLLGALSPASAYHGFEDALTALRGQEGRLQKNIVQSKREQLYAFDDSMCSCRTETKEEVTLLSDFVTEHCGGWGEASRCHGRVVQDVRRVAPFKRTVHFSGANFTAEAMRALKQQAVGHLEEQEETLTSVRRVIRKLVADSEMLGITADEVADRIQQAKDFGLSPDRTVTLHVNMHSGEKSCTCFKVTQPRIMWDAEDTTPDEVGTPGDITALADFKPTEFRLNSNLMKTLRGMAQGQGRQLGQVTIGSAASGPSEADLEELESDEFQKNPTTFEHYVDIAARKYARDHTGFTWIFLLFFPSGTMCCEPMCDSGPLMPPFDCIIGSKSTSMDSGCHWAPCSHVYHGPYSFPWAILGMSYFNSCPYGPLFQSCPHQLKSCPVNMCGLQYPERACLCSHPSGISNSDNHENNWYAHLEEKWNRRLSDGRRLNVELYGTEGTEHLSSKTADWVFIAPRGRVYDARLTDALYTFAKQGVSIRAVTHFTTHLTQLELIGFNPADANMQHMGITLEFSQPAEYIEHKFRFLTLEMMSNGMMWTLGETEAPTVGYVYRQRKTMTYNNLSLKHVARYLGAQVDRQYKNDKTDCQTIALELAQRLALHGRRLTGEQYLAQWNHDDGAQFIDQFSARFVAVGLVTALLLVVLVVLAKKVICKLSPKMPEAFAMKNAMMPAAFALALLSGTVALPVIAGSYWYWKRQQPQLESDAVDDALVKDSPPVE